MNLVTDAPTWLLALLFAALAAAAIEDFVRRRISNITCAMVFVTALIAMGLQGFTIDLWQNLAVFAVLLTLGTLMFASGKIGGGDVKLLASLGLWVNILAGVWLLFATVLAGGVLAIAYILARQLHGRRSKGIPYALAIVAGATITFAGQLGLMKQATQPPNPFQLSSLH